MQRLKLLVEVTVPHCVAEVMYKMLHPCPGVLWDRQRTTQSTSSSNQEIERGKRKGKDREENMGRRQTRKTGGVKGERKRVRSE